jgi:hypothetical protein
VKLGADISWYLITQSLVDVADVSGEKKLLSPRFALTVRLLEICGKSSGNGTSFVRMVQD